MINKYDYEKLLHGIKRISMVISMLPELKTKKLILKEIGLLDEEIKRLVNDLEEIRTNNGREDKN